MTHSYGYIIEIENYTTTINVNPTAKNITRKTLTNKETGRVWIQVIYNYLVRLAQGFIKIREWIKIMHKTEIQEKLHV